MAIVLIGMRILVAMMKCAVFLDTGDMAFATWPHKFTQETGVCSRSRTEGYKIMGLQG
jgi:hypothetical protein